MPQSNGSYRAIPESGGGFVAKLRALAAGMFGAGPSAAAAAPAPAPNSQDESLTITTPLLPRQK